MTITSITEKEVIKYSSSLPKVKGACEFKNDTGYLPSPIRNYQIITTDSMIEGVHYFRDANPFDIGHKLAIRNISDILTQFTSPTSYSLNIHVNPSFTGIESVITGIRSVLKNLGIADTCKLVGGDTVVNAKILTNTFTMTMFGETDKYLQKPQSGDLVCCTGSIGEAYLGYLAHQGEKKFNSYLKAFTNPTVPYEFCMQSAGLEGIHYATDISDGLKKDFNKVLKNFDLRGKIDTSAVCKHEECDFGDDYELLIFCTQNTFNSLLSIAKKTKIPLTLLGFIA